MKTILCNQCVGLRKDNNNLIGEFHDEAVVSGLLSQEDAVLYSKQPFTIVNRLKDFCDCLLNTECIPGDPDNNGCDVHKQNEAFRAEIRKLKESNEAIR